MSSDRRTVPARPALARVLRRRGILAVATFSVAAPTATIALAADTTVAADAGDLPAGRLAPAATFASDVHAAGRHIAEVRVVRAARKVAKLRGERMTRTDRRRATRGTVAQLLRRERRLRRAARELRRTGGAPAIAIPPQLAAIAACESGGNPRAIGGGGAFRGKYQFTYATWAAVGGSGDPAAAPEVEQDRRAAMLLARSGAGQWPVCGR